MKDQVFVDHPKLESYHKTSDGNAFYTKSDALNHARSLENKHVEEVKNPSMFDVDPAEEIETEAAMQTTDPGTKTLAAPEGSTKNNIQHQIASDAGKPLPTIDKKGFPAKKTPAVKKTPATKVAPVAETPKTE